MRRWIKAFFLLALMLLLPIFWLFQPVSGLPARFALSECRKLALTDQDSGQPIIGIEDIAMLPDGDRLILSATDLLALDRNPDRAPEGGLYEVSVSRLAAGHVSAEPLIGAGVTQGGLFPRGLAVSEDTERLAFINQHRDGTVSIIGGRLSRGGFDAQAIRTGDEFCRANDLDFIGGSPMEFDITIDGAGCGWSWADLDSDTATGSLISIDLSNIEPAQPVQTGLAFANGIAGFYVAETRNWRLFPRLGPPVVLPGGPDNLNWDGDHGLIAALHPSLWRAAAYRSGIIDSAPSRIVRVNLEREVEVLFDDPSGTLFRGASSAVLSGGVLVAGSVRDTGLLVCD